MNELIQELVAGVAKAPTTLAERNAIQRELILNLARRYPDVPLYQAALALGLHFAKRFPH